MIELQLLLTAEPLSLCSLHQLFINQHYLKSFCVQGLTLRHLEATENKAKTCIFQKLKYRCEALKVAQSKGMGL